MNESFRREVWSLPEQFLRVPEVEGRVLPAEGRLIVAAMGGSAMAGEFLTMLFDGRREARVVRDDHLLSPARPADVVLAISCSGRTQETLAAWGLATSRGCPRAAVASGGELLERADAQDATRVRIPDGLSPRSSLGHLIRGAAAAVGLEPATSWAEIAEHVGRVRARWAGESGPAAVLAETISGTLPAIIAHDPRLAVTARRWSADLSENAKTASWVWELPEAAHNAVMTVAKEAPRRLPLTLLSLGAPRRDAARRRWEALRAVLAAHGTEVVQVEEPHPDPWVEALGLAYVGDWVSVGVADREGAEAGSLSLMNDLKHRLAAGDKEEDEAP